MPMFKSTCRPVRVLFASNHTQTTHQVDGICSAHFQCTSTCLSMTLKRVARFSHAQSVVLTHAQTSTTVKMCYSSTLEAVPFSGWIRTVASTTEWALNLMITPDFQGVLTARAEICSVVREINLKGSAICDLMVVFGSFLKAGRISAHGREAGGEVRS